MKSTFLTIIMIMAGNLIFCKNPVNQPVDSEKTFAVIVGVSNYRDAEFPDLKYAHRDAEAFAAFLQSKSGGEVPKENIKLLTDAYATGARFNSALDWLTEKAMTAEKVIIYLSGYGNTLISEGESPEYFFLSDSPVTPLQAGAFEMKEIAGLINRIVIKKKPDFLLVANFYPLALPDHSDESIKKTKREKPLFSNAFTLNLTSSEDYDLKRASENISLESTTTGKITNNHLLLDGLLGLADKNDDQEVSFKELKKFLLKAEPTPSRLPGLLFLAVGRRYQPLVKVDTVILRKLALHNDDLFPSIIHLETGEKEDRILKTVSEEIQLTYQDFIVAVKLGNLLEPKEQNASYFYENLITKPEIKKLHSDMRRKLAAALQDEVQQALNAYLKLDNQELDRRDKMIDPYQRYTDYLARSIELFGARSFMSRIMKAKHRYFKGLVFRMQAVRDKRPDLFDEAVKSQQEALSFEPAASFVYNELGVVFSFKNHLDSAIYYFNQAIEYSPNWGIPYSNLSIVYTQKNEFETAVKYGITAFQKSPKNVMVSNTLANTYHKSGDLYSAKRMYQIVLEKDPKNFSALYNMACINALSDNKESAFTYLEKSLKYGWEDLDHLMTDKDLDSLRKEERFTELVSIYLVKKE